MKKFLTVATILLMFLIAQNCKKSNNSNNNNNNNDSTSYATDPDAIKAPVGGSTGTATSQSVDASGGTVVSSDGILHIIIPAGALSSATNISIQPVTNGFPGSVYNAYSLTPDGQRFQKPITLEFHYKDQDLDTLDPESMSVGFQLADQSWQFSMDQSIDTVNKTISIPTDHFSYRIIASVYQFKASKTTVDVNGQSTITHLTQYSTQTRVNRGFITSPAVHWRNFGAHPDDKWTVNNQPGGNGTFGYIVANDNGNATYTAPANVPSPNTVTVRKEFTDHGSRHSLSVRIKIRKPLKYRLDFVNVAPDIYIPGATYYDSAYIIIGINPDSTVNVPSDSIHNFPPTVTPTPSQSGGCTYTWTPDQVGTINITQCTGNLKYYTPDNYLLTIIVYMNNTFYPGFSSVCPPGNPKVTPGDPGAGDGAYPTGPFFVSLANPQIQMVGTNNEAHFRLTPLF
jgi:hypothetical protein